MYYILKIKAAMTLKHRMMEDSRSRLYSLVPRPSRGGREGLVRTVRAHARNYCEIYVREQWACTQNVIINYCTRVFEIRKVYTVVHRSSGDRKEERH